MNHIARVLRKKTGDELLICDREKNMTYQTIIQKIEKDKVVCFIQEKNDDEKETEFDITLFQGIPKFDKMEWIIQKNTEIGVKRIVPVEMIRSVAKIKDSKKIERWNTIAEIAAKQSMRNLIPLITDPMDVKKMCEMFKDFDIVFLAYEGEKQHSLKSVIQQWKKEKTEQTKTSIGMIIGPEGGIDPQEIEEISQNSNVKIITLGKRILRTETAGLVLASNIIYELED